MQLHVAIFREDLIDEIQTIGFFDEIQNIFQTTTINNDSRSQRDGLEVGVEAQSQPRILAGCQLYLPRCDRARCV